MKDSFIINWTVYFMQNWSLTTNARTLSTFPFYVVRITSTFMSKPREGQVDSCHLI